MVGGVLAAVTVTTKLSEEVRLPSLTVTVIVAEPDWPAAGVTVTVRLEPLPPNTTPDVGIKVVFEDERVRVKLFAAVSASLTVNASAPVEVPAAIVWSAMLLMTGAVDVAAAVAVITLE